jgi:hypothetical protein
LLRGVAAVHLLRKSLAGLTRTVVGKDMDHATGGFTAALPISASNARKRL